MDLQPIRSHCCVSVWGRDSALFLPALFIVSIFPFACLLAGLLAGGVCVLPSSRSTLAPPNPSSTKSPVSKPTPGHISCNTVSLDTLPDVIDR